MTLAISSKESVSTVLCAPDSFGKDEVAAVIIAHGAGNDMNHPLIVSLCEGLANAGYLAMRFNFPYKEQGRKAPDKPEILEITWQQAMQFLKDESMHPIQNIIAAGKSMGGRIASQMVVDGRLACTGLIFLGYPLHPAGAKERLKDEHLYRIKIPMLFFAGTRDSLCDLSMLKKVMNRLGPRAELEVIEGGDHSFHVPKSSSVTIQEVYAKIISRTVTWISGTVSKRISQSP